MRTAISIAGVVITPLREIRDGRGAVLHMLRTDAADFRAFGECYFSEVAPMAIKAWKRHHRQTQNLAVPVGRVRFVIYDARESSATCGCLEVVELGRPDAYARLCIPPMLFYGFTCTSEFPALVVNCTDIPHDSAESDTLALEALADGRALELLRRGLDV
jgi:dTDP-4-dehydrorhamnose 3,5-epimerase